jgi:hypothetical protein
MLVRHLLCEDLGRTSGEEMLNEHHVGLKKQKPKQQHHPKNATTMPTEAETEENKKQPNYSNKENCNFHSAFIHGTIREMLRIAPLYAGVLMQVLEDNAPHSRLSRKTQKIFVVHALHMTTYVPALLYRILVVVIDRMVAIDVAIKLEDVVREHRTQEREDNAREFDELCDSEEEEDEEEEESEQERRRTVAREHRKKGGRGSLAGGVLQGTCSLVLKELTAIVLAASMELKLGKTPHLLGAVLGNNRHITDLDLSHERGGLDASAGAAKLASMLAAGELPSLTQIRLGAVPEEATAAEAAALSKMMGGASDSEKVGEGGGGASAQDEVVGAEEARENGGGVADASLELGSMIDALSEGLIDDLAPGDSDAGELVEIDTSADDTEEADEGGDTRADNTSLVTAQDRIAEGSSCAMRIIRALMSHAALPTTIRIVSLELCNYCVGPHEAKVLGELLVSMRMKLTKLNLSDNPLCGNMWIPTKAILEGRYTLKGRLCTVCNMIHPQR